MAQVNRIRQRRSQMVLGSLFEPLEERIVLSGDAMNVFATFNGSIVKPGATQSIPITLSNANSTLGTGKAVLGFQLEASGSSLEPAVFQIKEPKGKPVQPLYTNPELAQNAQALTVAPPAMGTCAITARAARGRSVVSHPAEFLAGAATANRLGVRSTG